MVGRMTGSVLMVHSRASEPLIVSAPLIVSVSAIADPLRSDSARSPRGTIEAEVPSSGVPPGPPPTPIPTGPRWGGPAQCVFGPFRPLGGGPSIEVSPTPWHVAGGPWGVRVNVTRERGWDMTTTTVAAPVPARGGLANAFGRRQLYRYPDTLPRLGYLSIVVLTTIMLYYLYYEEGAVTPLLLPYYHMSFQYFLYLLVVSNAIGAFSAFVGGLSDKIGRANLTIYGTLTVALIQLFAIPHISDKFWFSVSYCVIGFVEGVILVSTPALMRDFSPQMGRGAGHGVLGDRPLHGRPGRQPGGHAHPHAT